MPPPPAALPHKAQPTIGSGCLCPSSCVYLYVQYVATYNGGAVDIARPQCGVRAEELASSGPCRDAALDDVSRFAFEVDGAWAVREVHKLGGSHRSLAAGGSLL